MIIFLAERNKYEPTVSDIIASSGIKRSVNEEYKVLVQKMADRDSKVAASRPELLWKKPVDPNSEDEDGEDEGVDDYAGDTADDDDY
jgi:hypothetical protein